MQATDLGYSHDGTKRRQLNAPRHRCIPLQGEVRPGLVVVADVFPEDPSEMVLAEDDKVIQALPAYRSDDSLGVGVLPGRLWGGEDLLDTDRPYDPPELVAVGTVPIPQQVARLGAVSGKGLPDLLGGPRGGGMGGDVEVNDMPAVVGEDHEVEEQAEGGGGDDEEIAGCRGAKVIPK